MGLLSAAMAEQQPKDSPSLWDTVEENCKLISSHGYVWYGKIKSKRKKFALIAALTGALFMVNLKAVTHLVTFAFDTTIKDEMTSFAADLIRYPNITICNRRYFTNSRLEGKLHLRH